MSVPRRHPYATFRGMMFVPLLVTAALMLGCQDQTNLAEPGEVSPSTAASAAASAPAASAVTFVGAGDMASCSSTEDEATAKLLDNIPGTVFTAGDNVYSDGSPAQFANCYEPTWGRHKARTRPTPGNHDYHTSGAAGYYAYYGANAGPSGLGYYSYDLGAWHLISLNSNISMSAGSVQEKWLRADLNGRTGQCVAAYWHHPRFSSGTAHGNFTNATPIWQALYDSSADLVIGGHEHNYERFAPQTPAGVLDNARGIREFVVGTGGGGHYAGHKSLPNSEVFDGSTSGVLKLTLGDGTYNWEFIPIAGKTFTDQGSGNCHGTGSGSPRPPDPTPTPPPSDTTPTPPPPTPLPPVTPPDPPLPGGAVPGQATRLILTPVDTIPIGPIGAAVQLLGRAFNGTTEVATPIKWWIGSHGRTATLSTTLCTSPCYITVTGQALGKTKVVIHEYVKGSTATWDTSWVKVTDTAPSGSPPPSPAPPPPSPPPPPPVGSAPVSTVIVSPNTASVRDGATAQLSATLKDAAGDILTGRTVSWTTNAASTATVNSSGRVTGMAAGSATITATSEGKSGTAAVTVTALPAPPPEPPPPPPPPSLPPPALGSGGCPTSGYTRLVNVSSASALSSALSGAQPGDQIRLAAGTYLGRTDLTRSGTASAPIMLCGMPGSWPVLRGGRFKLTGSYVVVTGLVFEGPNNNDVNVYMAGPHDVLFTHNVVRNSDWHAGLSCEESYNVEISYNLFSHNGGSSGEIDHGIYYRAQRTTPTTRNLIANNVIVGGVGRGISMHDNGGGAISYTTVVNNTIVRNGSTGILLALSAGTGNIIAGNIVADNGLTYDYRQIRWKSGTGNQIRNNITWSPVSSRSGMESMGSNTVAGNLESDPLFVAPYTDLHLRAGSPAIGLGLSGYVRDDFDGKSRDGAPDAGAFER